MQLINKKNNAISQTNTETLEISVIYLQRSEVNYSLGTLGQHFDFHLYRKLYLGLVSMKQVVERKTFLKSHYIQK